ncbi:MAG: FG-GAP repeat domain-containing protein [Verrucomicrobiota bacterium]
MKRHLLSNLGNFQLNALFSAFALVVILPVKAQTLGVSSKKLEVPTGGETGFERVDPEPSGITFINTLGELTGASNRVLFNGAGVAVGDVDGDSMPDIFFCGLDSENHLYRNLGNWKFQRMRIPSTVALPGHPTRGAVFADINADGSPDLLLTTVGGGCRVFLNHGEGNFKPVAGNAGIRPEGGASSIALADVDGNGSLDLYVANNRTDDIRDYGRVNMRRVNGKIVPPDDLKDRLLVHKGQLHEYGEPDYLYLNDGKGSFTEASWKDGRFRMEGKPLTDIPRDWGLSVTFRDLNGDLAPDLYVCNDYWTPDRIWINDGKGGFDELGAQKLSVTSSSSMGVDVADVNLDGHLDLFVVDMLSRHHRLRKRQQPAFNPLFEEPSFSGVRTQVMHNTLLMQQADGSFIENAFAAGLPASDWAWCPVFLDVDLDGDADLLVSSGYPHDVQDLDAVQEIAKRQHSWERFKDPVALKKAFAKELMENYRLYPKLDMPLIAFENQGNGTFREATQTWGTHHPGVHQGFATGDLDGDGDQDLVVNNLNAPVLLYRNQTAAPRVKVHLTGAGSNTQAIGARVVLQSATMPDQQQEIIAGGRYVSGGDVALTFAVPARGSHWQMQVHWRDGSLTTLPGIQVNHAYDIRQSEVVTQKPIDDTDPVEPMFKYVGDPGSEIFVPGMLPDPMMRQPLLPLQAKPRGGASAFSDIDQDGEPEWMTGSERGVPLKQMEWTADMVWKEMGQSAPSPATVTGLLEIQKGKWLVSYDAKPAAGEGTLHVRDGIQKGFASVGQSPDATTTLAMGPLNGRGALSVFAGGGAKSGHYPQAHASMLYDVSGSTLQRDTKNGVLLESLGLVHDAVWSDLNQDGYPELIVASAWSPIRVFENRRGSLFDVTEAWGFGEQRGYWLSVTTVDLDGDGMLDVVAGNLGHNSSWTATQKQPFKLIYGTFSNPNVTDLIETVYHSDGTLAPLRLIGEIGNFLPFFYQQIRDHLAYSEASLDTLLGNRKGLSKVVQANTFSSMAFINRGDKGFEPVELPETMQWGAVTELSVGDINGDGAPDIAYVQNQLWTRPGFGTLFDPRAGVLLGQGTGGLVRANPVSLGVDIMASVDGLRIADVTLDGRHDLMVKRREGAWELHANHRGKPGLKVIVNGPAHNPGALGAQIRTFDASGNMSACHEMREDTSMPFKQGRQLLIHSTHQPSGVLIRWPGGEERRYDLAPGALEFKIVNGEW